MKILALILICSGCCFAEVADSAANGFTVETSLDIQAKPDAVFGNLLHPEDWWNPTHTFSGDAHNLGLDLSLGNLNPSGCFCEKLTGVGFVRHMDIVYFAPAEKLVMRGALGPLQSLASTGSMTITLAPSGAGTKLTVNYAVVGYLAAGMNTLAAPVDRVIREQFTRLKNYIEQGDPFGSKPEKR